LAFPNVIVKNPALLLKNSLPLYRSLSTELSKNRSRSRSFADHAQCEFLMKALRSQQGNIGRINLPRSANGKVVIHIQDVHLNPEAQENIAKTISELIKDKKIGLVALEGAFGPIDLKRFQRYE